jgi:hypothetical protein
MGKASSLDSLCGPEGITPAVMKRCQWVKSILVAQVKFTEWTQDDPASSTCVPPGACDATTGFAILDRQEEAP